MFIFLIIQFGFSNIPKSQSKLTRTHLASSSPPTTSPPSPKRIISSSPWWGKEPANHHTRNVTYRWAPKSTATYMWAPKLSDTKKTCTPSLRLQLHHISYYIPPRPSNTKSIPPLFLPSTTRSARAREREREGEGAIAMGRIQYAAVARGAVVMAEHGDTAFPNAGAVARQILDRLSAGDGGGGGDCNVSYTQDLHVFHVKRTDGVTALCMADDAAGRKLHPHGIRIAIDQSTRRHRRGCPPAR